MSRMHPLCECISRTYSPKNCSAGLCNTRSYSIIENACVCVHTQTYKNITFLFHAGLLSLSLSFPQYRFLCIRFEPSSCALSLFLSFYTTLLQVLFNRLSLCGPGTGRSYIMSMFRYLIPSKFVEVWLYGSIGKLKFCQQNAMKKRVHVSTKIELSSNSGKERKVQPTSRIVVTETKGPHSQPCTTTLPTGWAAKCTYISNCAKRRPGKTQQAGRGRPGVALALKTDGVCIARCRGGLSVCVCVCVCRTVRWSMRMGFFFLGGRGSGTRQTPKRVCV